MIKEIIIIDGEEYPIDEEVYKLIICLQYDIDKAIELLEKTEIENSWFKLFKKKELSILRGEDNESN